MAKIAYTCPHCRERVRAAPKARHYLLCGDSTRAEDVARLMDGEKAALCFTSPPYAQQRDYAPRVKAKCVDWDALMCGVFANLPMTAEGQVLVNLGLVHREGEWWAYWAGWIEWMRWQGWRRFGWYVWDQQDGLPGDWGGRLAPSHEFVFHFNRKPRRPEKTVACKCAGVIPLAKNIRGRNGTKGPRSHAGRPVQDAKIPDSVIRAQRQKVAAEVQGHPAPFSVALAAVFLRAWPGTVYEPFCGSGTTIIAAEQLGRRCYAMEIEPRYVDVAVRRWEDFTGRKAKRDGTD